jgi:hypothetical protein
VRFSLLKMLLAAALGLGSGGCIRQAMLDGELQAARDASGALDTIDDYELARSAATGSLAQLEGMHLLAPDNPNGLFLLTKAWAGIGYAFIEDEMEAAEDKGDEALADYHRKRARSVYDTRSRTACSSSHRRRPASARRRRAPRRSTGGSLSTSRLGPMRRISSGPPTPGWSGST